MYSLLYHSVLYNFLFVRLCGLSCPVCIFSRALPCSVVCCLLSVVCRLSSVVCRLSSVVCRLSSVVCRLSSVVCRLSSVVCRLSCLVCRLSSVVCLSHTDLVRVSPPLLSLLPPSLPLPLSSLPPPSSYVIEKHSSGIRGLWAIWYRFRLLAPLLYSIIWSMIIMIIFESSYDDFKFPFLTGLTIFAGTTLFCLIGYGFLHWAMESFRMTSVTHFCFACAIFVSFCLQAAYTLVTTDEYEPTYVVFMTFNLFIMFPIPYLSRFKRDGLDFQMFEQLSTFAPANNDIIQQRRIKLRKSLRVLYTLAWSMLIIFALVTSSKHDTQVGWQVAGAIFFTDLALAAHDYAELITDPLMVNLLSVLARIFLLAFGQKNWFLGLCVNYFMFTSLLVYHMVDRMYPLDDPTAKLANKLQSYIEQTEFMSVSDSSSSSSSSGVDASTGIGTDTIGRSTRVSIDGPGSHGPGSHGHGPGPGRGHRKHDLTYHGALQDDSEEQQHKSVDERLGDTLDELLEFGDKVTLGTASRIKGYLASPLFAIGLLTVFFVGYIIFAFIADEQDWNDRLFPNLSLTAGEHPQYQYGLFSLLITWSGLFAFLSYRTYANSRFKATFAVIGWASIFVVLSSGGLIALSLLTDSNLLFVGGMFIPLLVVCTTLLYVQWSNNGFVWNSLESKQRKALHKKETQRREKELREAYRRKDTRQSIIKLRVSFAKKQVYNKVADAGYFVQGVTHRIFGILKAAYSLVTCHEDLDPRDYYIVFLTFMCILLCALIAIILEPLENSQVAFIAAAGIGISIMTIFLALQWMNGFEIGRLLVAGIIWLLIWPLGFKLRDAGVNGYVVAASEQIYASILWFGMAFYHWKQHNYKILPINRNMTILACINILIGVIIMIIHTDSWGFAAISIIIYCVGLFSIAAAARWASNDFRLSGYWKIASFAIGSLIAIATLVVVIASHLNWFWAFSTVWLYMFLSVMIAAIPLVRETSRAKLHPSRWIFPVYKYDPSSHRGMDSLETSNTGHALLFLGCIMLMIWGAMAGLIEEPHFVGWVGFGMGLLGFLLIVLRNVFDPTYFFWTNWESMSSHPMIIAGAVTQSMESEYQARESAMDTSSAPSNMSQDSSSVDVVGDDDDDAAVQDHTMIDHDGNDDGNDDGDDHKHNATTTTTNKRKLKLTDSQAAYGHDDPRVYLHNIRKYWDYNMRADLAHQLAVRNRLLYRVGTVMPAGIGLCDCDFSGERLNAERLAATLIRLRDVRLLDRSITRTFEQQSRIVVRFMLLLNAAAEANRKLNRSILLDFLRSDKDNELLMELAGLEKKPLHEVTAWLQDRSNVDRLRDAVDAYTKERRRAALLAAKKALVEQHNANRRRADLLKLQRERRQRLVEESDIATPTTTTATATAASSSLSGAGSNIVAYVPSIQKPMDSIQNLQAFVDSKLQTKDGIGLNDAKAQDRFNDDEFPLQLADDSYGTTSISIDSEMDRVDRNAIGRLTGGPDTHSNDSKMSGQSGQSGQDVFRRPNEYLAGQTLSLFSQNHDDPIEHTHDHHVNPDDVIQGELEDCYFLSALSVLATEPSKLTRLFLVKEHNEQGVYGATFFSEGEWQPVFVDDRLPIGNDGKPMYAHNLEDTELWVPILEKAYAKWHGGYSMLNNGGFVHDSLRDLTGGYAQQISLSGTGAQQLSKVTGSLWQRLLSFKKAGHLMGCGNPRGANTETEANQNGIVPGHAYAVLDIREVDDHRLLQLRNPWGDEEWKLDWSDYDIDRWSNGRYRALLNYTESSVNDGKFWMSFEDFLLNFERIYLCRVLQRVNSSDNTYTKLTSKWHGRAAAGAPTPKNVADSSTDTTANPQFSLHCSRQSLLYISLTQRPIDADAKTVMQEDFKYPPIGLFVVEKKATEPYRVRAFDKSEVRGALEGDVFQRQRQVGLEVQIEPDRVYNVYTCTYTPGVQMEFDLELFSKQKFVCEAIRNDVQVL
jgi:Calpain family cysteine protease